MSHVTAAARGTLAGRNYGLDVLRSWAVLFVLLSHGSAIFFAHLSHRKLVDVLGWLGFVGVELFFALSGFLIGGILLRTGQQLRDISGIYGFWRKRWYRTLPNYYVYLVLHVVLIYTLAGTPRGLVEQGKYFFFLQGFAWQHPGFFAEAWSLAIEEWFYLLTPIFVAVLLRLGCSVRTAFFAAVTVFISMPLLMRWGLSVFHPELTLEVHRKTVVLRLDGIMYGVVAAIAFHYWPELFKKFRWLCLTFSIALFAAIFRYQFIGQMDIFHDVRFNTLVLAGTPMAGAALVPFFFHLSPRFAPVIQFHFLTARLSYSLYLCNLLVLSFMVQHLNPKAGLDWVGAGLLLLLFISACYAVAELSYRWVEKPGLALRDRSAGTHGLHKAA